MRYEVCSDTFYEKYLRAPLTA